MNFRLIFITAVYFMIIPIFSAKSQSEGILWSQEFAETKDDKMNNIIYDSGTNVYVFVYTKVKGDQIVPGILRLDSNMVAQQRKDYAAALTVKGEVSMLGLFYYGNNFVMLTYVEDKKSNSTKVYAALIDIETLEPKQASKEIWEVSAPKGRNVKLDYSISSDTSIFVVNATIGYGTWVPEYYGWDAVMSSILFKVFDANLNPVNERKTELKYRTDRYTRLNYFINNDGNMFYFSKQYFNKQTGPTTKNDAKKVVASYNLSVLQFHPNGMDKETILELGEKLLDDIEGDYDPVSNDFIVFITYGDIENPNRINPKAVKCITSYEFIRFNTTSGEIVKRKVHEFSSSLVEIIKVKENLGVHKNTSYISNLFGIFDVKIMDDGRVYLILSRDYTSDVMKVSQGVICYLYDLDGNKIWENFIPKRQQFDKNDYIYSSLIYRKNKVMFIYNEHTKILENDPFKEGVEPRIFNSWTESILMKVEIDNDGKMSHGPIASSEQMKTSFSPRRSIAGKNNRFILYGWKIKDEISKIGVMNLN